MKRLKNQLRKLMPHSKRQVVVWLIALVVLAIGGMVIYKATRPSQPATEPTITYSTNQPDESKANADNYSWQGAPDEPKKLTISKIGVNAIIQQTGVDQNNEIAVPNNVHLTGWFTQSVKPGQNGLAIIAGHVSGRTTNGVFENLQNIQKGDEFEIERGDGTVLKYRVIDTQQVAADQAASVLFSQSPTVTSQVNLVTCGGKFNSSTNRYHDRIIVSGELQ